MRSGIISVALFQLRFQNQRRAESDQKVLLYSMFAGSDMTPKAVRHKVIN